MFNYIDEYTLQDVEERRKRFRLTDKIFISISLVLWGSFIWSIFNNFNNLIIPSFLPFLITFISIIFIVRNRIKFINYYKENLVVPNIKRNFPYYKYDPKGKILESDFKASSLYGHFNRYGGDDYLEDSGIKFSELDVAYVRSSSGSSSSSSRQTIFQGVFVVADLPFYTNNIITIKKRINLDKIPNIIKKFLPEELTNPKNCILTGNQEFDELFILQTIDPEYNKLINSSIIRKIINLGHEAETFTRFSIQSPISLSVIDNRLFMGISGVRLFDIKYGKSTTESSEMLEKSISIINNIIEFTNEIKKYGNE